ncbi:MAG: hypothetical protein Ta2B_18480 [Termitinemataceae bacterium]|nr:MAG: hypothetical protein Ta2B_18480 [Termitinemataceae bacterium]
MAENDINTQVNERIKQIRTVLKFSQVKFAKIISISNGYMAEIEQGKNKANDRIIKLVCSSFNVNERWLRFGEGDMFSDNPNEQYTKLLSLYKELEPKYQEYVLKQIDLLLDIQNRDAAAIKQSTMLDPFPLDVT